MPYEPTDEDLLEFGVLREDITDMTFYQGQGCEDCNYSGYKGRMGLFEFLAMSEKIVDLILENATTDDIHAHALLEGMASLRQDGWIKICMGLTTFAEVSSHTPMEDMAAVMSHAKNSG